MKNKEELIIEIIPLLFLVVIFTLFIIASKPSKADIDAYNKCMKTYNNQKTCNKLIYGNY